MVIAAFAIPSWDDCALRLGEVQTWIHNLLTCRAHDDGGCQTQDRSGSCATGFCRGRCGQNINPDGLANQIEGGMIQSTSWALHEAVPFDRNGITSRDWSGYPILTMPEAPETFVTLIDHNQAKPLGAGEASQGPMAAAIANAFANATGRRLRDLPFSPERVQAALG
jgi:hypothetical protein